MIDNIANTIVKANDGFHDITSTPANDNESNVGESAICKPVNGIQTRSMKRKYVDVNSLDKNIAKNGSAKQERIVLGGLQLKKK